MTGVLVAAGAGLGLLVGSYLATLTLRWPQGRTTSSGRSACDGCARPLAFYELVPLLSFAVLRGRCRTCAAAIDQRHPLIEIAAALIGGAALWASPDMHGFLGAIFGWALLTLAILDLEHFWLPDALTLPLILVGLALGVGFAPSLTDRLIGAAVGWSLLAGIAFLYQYLRGRQGLGGGDPKLFAAIGAWLGWVALPLVLTTAALIGLLAVAVARLRGREITGATRLPFGAPLAIAGWLIWLADSVARPVILQ
ncbi:prepilin peptidase [Sphingoaurantiacus capsulatus]|uniref:Prepilin leader peptidase/N-methyltransferase n=1 Tax=Sphingoaurantiacus capsulatus TaxID=1771310 RepID=A0ABV7X4S4_9SPHN